MRVKRAKQNNLLRIVISLAITLVVAGAFLMVVYQLGYSYIESKETIRMEEVPFPAIMFFGMIKIFLLTTVITLVISFVGGFIYILWQLFKFLYHFRPPFLND